MMNGVIARALTIRLPSLLKPQNPDDRAWAMLNLGLDVQVIR